VHVPKLYLVENPACDLVINPAVYRLPLLSARLSAAAGRHRPSAGTKYRPTAWWRSTSVRATYYLAAKSTNLNIFEHKLEIFGAY